MISFTTSCVITFVWSAYSLVGSACFDPGPPCLEFRDENCKNGNLRRGFNLFESAQHSRVYHTNGSMWTTPCNTMTLRAYDLKLKWWERALAFVIDRKQHRPNLHLSVVANSGSQRRRDHLSGSSELALHSFFVTEYEQTKVVGLWAYGWVRFMTLLYVDYTVPEVIY